MKQRPVQSRLLEMKEQERLAQIRERQLKTVRGQIDNKPPKQLIKRGNPKNDLMQDQQSEDIEKQNQFLLKKITNIMHREKKNSRSITALNQQGSYYNLQNAQNTEPSRKSLNYEVRKQEIMRVMLQNQEMMKKLSQAKPTIDNKKFMQERQKNEKIVANIMQYQYKDFPPTKTLLNKQTDIQPKEKVKCNNIQQTTNNYQDRSFTPNRLQPLGAQGQNARILHRRSKKFGLNLYIIEVRLDEGLFKITLENAEKNERRYEIEFTEKEGTRILRDECQFDFNLLLDRIKIDEQEKSIYFRRLDNQDYMPGEQVIQSEDSKKVKKIIVDNNKIYRVSYINAGDGGHIQSQRIRDIMQDEPYDKPTHQDLVNLGNQDKIEEEDEGYSQEASLRQTNHYKQYDQFQQSEEFNQLQLINISNVPRETEPDHQEQNQVQQEDDDLSQQQQENNENQNYHEQNLRQSNNQSQHMKNSSHLSQNPSQINQNNDNNEQDTENLQENEKQNQEELQGIQKSENKEDDPQQQEGEQEQQVQQQQEQQLD